MRSALVTGAAGFIGSHLVDGLLEQGWNVTGLDDLSTGTLDNLTAAQSNDRFTFIEGDIRSKSTVKNAIDGCDTVFHQAAFISVPDSFDQLVHVTAVNCHGTSIVLDAAKEADVDSAVVASSASVYGNNGTLPIDESTPVDPQSPYATSKYYTERLALHLDDTADLEVTALRYFNVYGPRQGTEGGYAAVIPTFIDLMVDNQRPTIFGDGDQTRDFVYIADVVAANIAAATSYTSGEVINVASGKRTSINELVSILNGVLNTNIDPMYDDPRPGDIRHSQADINRARNTIGFEPSVDMQEGLRRIADALQ